MQAFAWIFAALAAMEFALSFPLDTRLAPLGGAACLFLAMAWATVRTKTASRASYDRAERETAREAAQDERMKRRAA